MKKILLVDDEKDFLFPMGELLSNRGYEIYSATSYNDAIKVLKDEAVEIVVCDIILPEHDGFELIMYLNDNYPDIKIMWSNGYA